MVQRTSERDCQKDAILEHPLVWVRPSNGILPPMRDASCCRHNRAYPSLEKIVRGLYFHHTGCLLARDTEFRWLINEHEFADSRRLGYFAVATPGLCCGDEFGSRYTLGAEHGVDGAVWWPSFYESTMFTCVMPDARATRVHRSS